MSCGCGKKKGQAGYGKGPKAKSRAVSSMGKAAAKKAVKKKK
jgi:hypothetical protein